MCSAPGAVGDHAPFVTCARQKNECKKYLQFVAAAAIGGVAAPGYSQTRRIAIEKRQWKQFHVFTQRNKSGYRLDGKMPTKQ